MKEVIFSPSLLKGNKMIHFSKFPIANRCPIAQQTLSVN
ncbi:hypothetical protein D082_10920 [Synechocystis sp. PCC 6714]|nr:hypothetical protein D082_10920 [Synechocystis sp. PCC 6714]